MKKFLASYLVLYCQRVWWKYLVFAVFCRIFQIFYVKYNELTLKNSCIPIFRTQVLGTFKRFWFKSQFYTSTGGAICGNFFKPIIRETQSLSIIFALAFLSQKYLLNQLKCIPNRLKVSYEQFKELIRNDKDCRETSSVLVDLLQ